MKKTFFTSALLCICLLTFAQTGTDKEYKQYANAKNLEVQFAPLGGTPISIGGLRFRSFTSDKSAIRLNVFLGINSSSDKNEVTNGNGDDVFLKSGTSSFTLQARPGIEYHFAGTARLSPYYGAEAIIGYRSSGQSAEAFDTDGVSVIKNKVKNPANDGYIRLGANAVLGVDYYFAKSIYLGTEVGFGFQFDFEGDEVTKPANGDETTTSEGGTSFNFGPNAVGQIRLGFLF